MSTITLCAAAAPLVWLAWLALTDWVPMFPLNDLESSDARVRARRAMGTYPVALLIAAGVIVNQTWSLVVALVLAAGLVLGHLAYWWLPYAGVAVDPQLEIYRREYFRTVKAVPAEGHLVVVDVQHAVAGLLTFVVLVTTVFALLQG